MHILQRVLFVAAPLLVLVAVAACGGRPTELQKPHPEPTITSKATSPATSLPSADEEREQEYRKLASEVLNSAGQLARIISDIGISLAGKPEDAAKTEVTVEATKGGFDLAQEWLERADPPKGYEEFHQMLLEALSFYTQASAALLPDSQPGKADYWRFQELMLQGGKSFHAAGAEMSKLPRSIR